MQYAQVNGLKVKPQKGVKGICLGCGNETVSKCGGIKVHHWAHKSIIDCDPWGEPETEWHRNWKNQFPEDYQEIYFKDEKTGEVHRADIHTKNGVTLELQNSPIAFEELQSREAFYRNLIWVVNATKIKSHLLCSNNIWNPEDPVLAEFDFGMGVFFRKSDLLRANAADYSYYERHHEQFKGLKPSPSHFQFHWKNSHSVWYWSNANIFLDYDDKSDNLYWLKKRNQVYHDFWYVVKMKKTTFISKYST